MRQDVGDVVEAHGPQLLSAPELERFRAVSSYGRRGASQAAPAARARQTTANPNGKASSPSKNHKARLRPRPRTPERPPPTLTLTTRALSPGIASPKRARRTTRSPSPRRGRQAASAAGAVGDIPDPTPAPKLDQNLARIRENKRDMRLSAVASSAAASSVAAPIPASTPPLPPPSHTPRSSESSERGKRVEKKALPPAVGSVALALASQPPQGDASKVYTRNADEHNNQHCTILSTDNDISWSGLIMGCLAVAMLTLALKHFVDQFMRY